MTAVLEQPVLVLNRLWQAVNVCSVRRALTLLFEGHAQVVFGVGDGDYRTLDFQQWRDLSKASPDPEGSGNAVLLYVASVRFLAST